MFLICIIIYKTFKISLNKKQNTYQEFLIDMMPQKLKNNKILIYTISNIINLFLLISFNIMVAGFATYFFQELSFPKIIGGVVISIVSFITFYKGINGVIKINTYLIPSLIVLIIFLGVKKITTIEIIETNTGSLYWIISGILYASYNSITLIPILISLKNEINNKKEARNYSYFYIYYNEHTISKYISINEHVFKCNKKHRTSYCLHSKYFGYIWKIYLWSSYIDCYIYNRSFCRIWFFSKYYTI